MNDYYQWLSGKPKKLAAACPSGREVQPGDVRQLDATPFAPDPAARAIEVQEDSATETFIGRVRDFWNLKK